jgi:methylase of polypeptide subunit release factors
MTDIFFELHQNLPREGPGDAASTLKAFRLMKNLPAQPRILDVGCGPGMQTIELAKHIGYARAFSETTPGAGKARRVGGQD